MDASGRHTDPPGETIACLIRIQQVMLAKGYIYIAGDRNAWPDTPVQMDKEESNILITPYRTGTANQILDAWDQDEDSTALLLVGEVDINAPEIDELLAHKKSKGRKLAYIDAAGGQFRTPMSFWSLSTGGKEALQSSNLKTFLNANKCKSSADIDCPDKLAEHMQEHADTERFIRTATRLSRFRQASLSIGMIVLFSGVLAIMTIIYGLQMLYEPSLEVLLDWGALNGPLVKTGQWWRMFSVALLHGGFMHLACNCLFLLVFGTLLETYQGSWRTLLYFIAGVGAGSIASVWWHPEVVGVGASGGLFGLLGAIAALIIRHRRDFPKRLWQSWRKMVLMLLLYNGMIMLRPQVDGAAHIGGLIGGFATAFVLARSPVKIVWPRLWVWPAMVGVLLTGLVIASRVIENIPDETLSIVREIADSRNAKRDLAILKQLAQAVRRCQRLVTKLRNHMGDARSTENIRSDTLRQLGPPFTEKLEMWRQQLTSPHARKTVRLAAALNAARVQYCQLITGSAGGIPELNQRVSAGVIMDARQQAFEGQLDVARTILRYYVER